MRSINDALPSEPFLTTFKKVETGDMVKAKEVCKLWWNLIDDSRIFWRVVNLSEIREQARRDSSSCRSVRREQRINFGLQSAIQRNHKHKKNYLLQKHTIIF